MSGRPIVIGLMGLISIVGCSTWQLPQVQVGTASWDGPGFHGKNTASGEIYDMHSHTAAHPTLPFGSRVRVTRLDTGHSTVVRINDRGPFVEGRIIDLSNAAARDLDMVRIGIATVQVEIIYVGGLPFL